MPWKTQCIRSSVLSCVRMSYPRYQRILWVLLVIHVSANRHNAELCVHASDEQSSFSVFSFAEHTAPPVHKTDTTFNKPTGSRSVNRILTGVCSNSTAFIAAIKNASSVQCLPTITSTSCFFYLDNFLRIFYALVKPVNRKLICNPTTVRWREQLPVNRLTTAWTIHQNGRAPGM